MWVRFTRKFNWRTPGKPSFLTYPAGRAFSVKAQCGADAIAAGAAVPVATPKKGAAKAEPSDGAGA